MDRDIEAKATAGRLLNATGMNHVAVADAHTIDAVDFDLDSARGISDVNPYCCGGGAVGADRRGGGILNGHGNGPARLCRSGGTNGKKENGGAREQGSHEPDYSRTTDVAP